MRDFSQFGIYGCYLPVNLWKKTLIVLEKRNKFIKNKANKTLAGNIKEEYDIPELIPEYGPFICAQIMNFPFFEKGQNLGTFLKPMSGMVACLSHCSKIQNIPCFYFCCIKVHNFLYR